MVIHVSEATQHLSNFYYDHHVYSFCSLPQGWVNACFVGASATEMAYGQNAMLEFLKFKGWEINSVEWPWNNISELLIIYMDDLCAFSDNDKPGHVLWSYMEGSLNTCCGPQSGQDFESGPINSLHLFEHLNFWATILILPRGPQLSPLRGWKQ